MLLPPGVTLHQWALEKVSWQNPRIRAFLGCIQLLGEVFESNYAILHCSPDRLDEIWSKVRRVCDAIDDELVPLLSAPSLIPGLERARRRVLDSARMLRRTTIEELRSFPDDLPPEGLLEVRKTLCTSMGQIYGFLQDAFGEIMTNDPRSRYDADYFLSRRFHQDVEDAEWLYRTVHELEGYLRDLDTPRRRRLSGLAALLLETETFPDPRVWAETSSFLDELISVLTPRLKQVLALPGVRFEELEILDRYACEVPTQCQILQTTYETGRDLLDRLAGTNGRLDNGAGERCLEVCRRVLSRRLAGHLDRLDQPLKDLTTFVPLWRTGIGKRRALLLHSPADSPGSAG